MMPRQAITAQRQSGQATYVITDAPPIRGKNARQRSNSNRPIRDYGPTRVADKASSGIGLLEAEYFAILFLLILELFVGTASYGDKMVSVMKRGTLVTVLFFILALIAGVGPNASKISKGIGALVFVTTLLSSPGNSLITAMDNFAKADWIGNSGTSANAGTQGSTGTAISSATSKAEKAASNSANLITEINLPGIGPVFAVNSIANSLKKLFHL